MSNETHARHPLYGLLHTDVEGIDSLAELALDMRSLWDHATDQVWRQLDPDLRELTQNPWGVLQAVSREKPQGVLVDTAFRKNVDDLVQARRVAAESPAWFQQTHPQSPLSCVACFSMEFLLSEALPIYSGGLDTLVFAGGIGENAPLMRERICDGLGFLGIELSQKRNSKNAPLISPAAGRVKVRVIRTDEELMIARSGTRVLELGTTR